MERWIDRQGILSPLVELRRLKLCRLKESTLYKVNPLVFYPRSCTKVYNKLKFLSKVCSL